MSRGILIIISCTMPQKDLDSNFIRPSHSRIICSYIGYRILDADGIFWIKSRTRDMIPPCYTLCFHIRLDGCLLILLVCSWVITVLSKEFYIVNHILINFSRWLEVWTRVLKVIQLLCSFNFLESFILFILSDSCMLFLGTPKTVRTDKAANQVLIINVQYFSTLFMRIVGKCFL